MSHILLKDEIIFEQRILSAAGLYTGKIDGLWGPKTEGADREFDLISDRLARDYGVFDFRSEKSIRSLIPAAQLVARQFMNIVYDKYPVKIISGTRTYYEQDVLYAQKPKVTNAKGGHSRHNFGLAWDIGLYPDGEYLTSQGMYIELSKIVLPKLINTNWGGNWKDPVDVPHYQIKTEFTLTGLREAFEKGFLKIILGV